MSMLLFLALLSSWGTDIVQGNWVSLGGDFQGKPSVELLESGEYGARVRIEIPGYGTWNESGSMRLDLSGYGHDPDAAVGTPELPAVPVVIGIPAGMDYTAEVEEVNWVSAGTGRIYPVQPPMYDSGSGTRHFAELSGDLRGTYPAGTLSHGERGTWNCVDTAVLRVHPFRWNSETGELQAASSIILNIGFTGSREFQTPVRPEVAAMHRSRIINYDALQVPVNDSPVTSEDVVYVCVVPPENLETVTPLLALVNSLGHRVHVAELESGSTSTQIKFAINSVYQPGITRFALIPARHQQLESRSFGSFVGDFYYECLDSDNLPDIAVGRYPGNSTQLENQISKAMSYVQWTGTPGEPSVSASVILAAHEEEYPGKYTANSNAVRDWSYALADPVFETCYPPEGGTAEQVQNAMDDAVGIVNYRGHGSNTTWQWSPGWNAGKIYDLENTFFPPVFNVACSNGNHAEVYNCLSESWMDAPGVGASGNVGASAPSLTTVNNRMQRVLFWEIFDEGNTCAGEVFSAAQTDIIQTQGAGGLNNSRMYHWFGDPSMDICNSDQPGAPFAMSADFPEVLNTGENNLLVTVTSSGAPLQGALVTVTDGIGNHPDHTESFYAQGITDGSGQATLSFTVLEGHDLYYGVRLHNHGSLHGTIDVTTEGIEGGTPAAISLMPVSPSPARGSAAVSFQAPPGAQVTLRVLDLTGRTVATLLQGAAPGGVSSLEMDLRDYSPGIYFAVLQSGGTTLTERMAVVR